MRARLVAVILLSVVPLAVLSSVVAWHNYRATAGSASARARTIAETLKGQSDQQIADTSRLLDALSRQPELRDPATCAGLLHLADRLLAARLVHLSLLASDGLPACGGRDAAVAAVPAAELPRGTALALRPILAGEPGDRRPLLRFLLPTKGPNGPAVLSAVIPLGWTAAELATTDLWHARPGGGQTTAWLVLPTGELFPLCPDCDRTDADPGDGLHRGDGRFREPHLVGDVGLLVSTRATPAERHALALFAWRVSVTALLLALGLVAVLTGAAFLITRPLRATTAAVTAWRRAGAFFPASTRRAPVELRKLSYAFADATRSLAAHEERLRRAEIKQQLLIKEIHHRVKNNLQIIASLLNLQANRIRHDGARAEFASARDRVRALATLHRHLYAEGELHTLNMKSFLEELCGQLLQAIGEKEGRRISLAIDAPEITMSTDQAVPLALVVTEAVSNAFKYAFPGGRSGTVSVHLVEEAAGIARLVIQDDGVGIPAGRAETETGVRDGLGIQLIRGFARQLGATLDVEEGAVAGRGTRYSLMVPLQPESEAADPAAEAEATASR
ncbi:MAG: sensor histidine kinase [Gluconacetobacter diazotrophicus]|nr:sensor histidine kinase [Gluconacetobacter diazotrophicus]